MFLSFQYDAGGPLMCSYFGNFDVVCGIVSFGYGCSGTLPGVYCEVSNYIQWLNDNMED